MRLDNGSEHPLTAADGVALGRQLTVEFYDCSPAVLSDAAALEKVFLAAASDSGAHVVTSVFHSFEPQGVSGVVVISESHFAVHAWPEHDYAAVDLFTCGSGVDFDVAIKSLARGMGSGNWIVSGMVNRGIIGGAGVERLIPVAENSHCSGLQLSWEKRFRSTDARAISCCIDLYECRSNLHSGDSIEEIVRQLAEPLAGANSPEPVWSCEIHKERNIFCLTLPQSRINGFVLPDERKVFLDFFADGFFDPRTIAESAVRLFQGLYYRMQVQVRQ